MNKGLLIILISLLISPGISYSQEYSEVYNEINSYKADQGALLRKYPQKYSGIHLDRMASFYQSWTSKLGSIKFNSLSLQGKVDFVLLQRNINRDQFFLKEQRQQYEEIKTYLPFEAELNTLITERGRGKALKAEATAGQYDALHNQIKELKTTVEKGAKLPYRISGQAAEAVKQFQEGLKDVHEFYSGYDPLYSWWCQKPFEKLNSTLTEYAALLKSYRAEDKTMDDGSGIIGTPIGQEALKKSLEFEFIAYSPQELLKIAEREFAWCEKEMLQASKEMGHGNNWKAALEQVKQTYPEPGSQPELVTKLAEEAITFLEERDMVTIPDLAKETWRMRMLSPEEQLISPFFLGGEQVRISYPTDAMEHETKMMSLRGNNPHFSKAVVHHELIPGHHLQQFMNQRHKPYRWPFRTPFWTEGWALYWEMVLYDAGFPTSPEDKVGMLFWRMHRCARIIFSINYHTGKMTPQQCINFLVDKVGHERDNAAAEVRRSLMGNYGPLYQMAYMLGGLQIRALRQELVDTGKMTEKHFHDQILKENNMPIEILRMIMTEESPKKDHKPFWKF